MKLGDRLRSRRGNALVEYAITLPFMVAILAGLSQFGYTFFVYNSLRSTVHSGARFASVADYDEAGSNFQNQVKNVTVYGTPTPDVTDRPLVPGLTTAMVDVLANQPDAVGIPRTVTVVIHRYEVPGIWQTIAFEGKPRARFPYTGQFIDD